MANFMFLSINEAMYGIFSNPFPGPKRDIVTIRFSLGGLFKLLKLLLKKVEGAGGYSTSAFFQKIFLFHLPCIDCWRV